MTDLHFESDEDLIDELLSRYEHACFVGLKVLTGDEDVTGIHQVRRRYKGNSHTVIGLLHDAQNFTHATYLETDDEPDPTDPE